MKLKVFQARSVPELRTLQRAFFQIVSRPLAPHARMKFDPRCNLLIRPSAAMAPHERLELYAQQYWWRVLDSLREDFPALQVLLGERAFSGLLTRYLQRCPSQSFTLRNLGGRLPAFVSRDRHLSLSLRQRGAAVARTEWAQIQSFDAAALPSLASLGGRVESVERVRLKLQPHVQLLELPFTIDEFIGKSRAIGSRADASNVRTKHAIARERRAVRGALRSQLTRIVVYRRQNRVRMERLDRLEYSLLQELQRGGTLAQIFGRILRKRARVSSATVQQAFQRFAQIALIGFAHIPGK